MKWNIIADSACDLMPSYINSSLVSFSTIPFILSIDNHEYIDDESMDTLAMLDHMEHASASTSSACPSPHSWEEEFKKADYSIAITISSNLSGCHNSAALARDNVLSECPEKKIHILDSLSTGPECALCIYSMIKQIEEGHDFDTVIKNAQEFLDQANTAFALCSFDNLVKSGRMNKLVGFVAKTLGMWGVGVASKQGTIAIKGKTRGVTKAIGIITDYMDDCGFSNGDVIISHAHNPEAAQRLKNAINDIWSSAKVSIIPARGLDSYYAERGGLIVGFK